MWHEDNVSGVPMHYRLDGSNRNGWGAGETVLGEGSRAFRPMANRAEMLGC
jgi:hypothetical protein